jgi:uncharacterized protein YjiS (DUF1127 family)
MARGRLKTSIASARHPGALVWMAFRRGLRSAHRWTLELAHAWRTGCRQRTDMVKLSDHLLRDIGVSRFDADRRPNVSFRHLL